MKKIGYVRVSSQDQNEKRQIKQLNEIGVDIIYEEKISGATMDREKLKEMLDELKSGDTIFVTDLTRITYLLQYRVDFSLLISLYGVASGKCRFHTLS